MTRTNITSGERRRRLEIYNRFANSRTKKVPEYGHFFNPQGAIKSFIKGIVHHKFGFHLKNPGGFLHTTVMPGGRTGFIFFFTTGTNRLGVRLLAAAGVIHSLLYGTIVFRREEGERRGRTRAVAIYLLHTYSDRSGKESGNP